MPVKSTTVDTTTTLSIDADNLKLHTIIDEDNLLIINPETDGFYSATINEGAIKDVSAMTWSSATEEENGKIETGITFLNKVADGSASAKFSVEKKISGITGSTKEFSFKLTPKNENANDNTKVSSAKEQTKSVNGAGSVDFDSITYKAEGRYTYTIVEVQGSEAGYTYDKSEYEAIVDVTDNGTGKLSASTKIKKVKDAEGKEIENQTEETAASVTYENRYSAGKADGFILKVDRLLTEANPVREEGVQFQVYDAVFDKGAPVPTDKRMLFMKKGRDEEGSNIYEFTKEYGARGTIASENATGDTLETGSNGMIRIIGISRDMKLTAVETKNLPGYASYTTNHPTPVTPVDEGTKASEFYQTLVDSKDPKKYFVDAPEKTSLHVTKKFTDGNTSHPKDEIEVTLYKIVGDKEEALTTAKLNAGNEWKVSFDELPMRDNVGNLVKYQVRETKGGEGYTVSYSPSNISQLDGDHKYKDITVTNTKEEEKPKESETPKPTEGPKQKRRVPKTSDNFNSFFWMGSLLVSIVTGCWAALTLHRYE